MFWDCPITKSKSVPPHYQNSYDLSPPPAMLRKVKTLLFEVIGSGDSIYHQVDVTHRLASAIRENNATSHESSQVCPPVHYP